MVAFSIVLVTIIYSAISICFKAVEARELNKSAICSVLSESYDSKECARLSGKNQ